MKLVHSSSVLSTLITHWQYNIEMANIIDDGYFFEATEKLLEIWFSSENEAADLRKIGRYFCKF